MIDQIKNKTLNSSVANSKKETQNTNTAKSVVKKVDNSVLLMRNVAIETEVMENNAVWRFKTYEAFKDKAINISDEYGVDFDEVELHQSQPHIHHLC